MKILVTDFLAPIGASVFIFCVVTKTAIYYLSVSLFVHFSFPPLKILTGDSNFFLSKIFQQLLDLGF